VLFLAFLGFILSPHFLWFTYFLIYLSGVHPVAFLAAYALMVLSLFIDLSPNKSVQRD